MVPNAHLPVWFWPLFLLLCGLMTWVLLHP